MSVAGTLIRDYDHVPRNGNVSGALLSFVSKHDGHPMLRVGVVVPIVSLIIFLDGTMLLGNAIEGAIHIGT